MKALLAYLLFISALTMISACAVLRTAIPVPSNEKMGFNYCKLDNPRDQDVSKKAKKVHRNRALQPCFTLGNTSLYIRDPNGSTVLDSKYNYIYKSIPNNYAYGSGKIPAINGDGYYNIFVACRIESVPGLHLSEKRILSCAAYGQPSGLVKNITSVSDIPTDWDKFACGIIYAGDTMTTENIGCDQQQKAIDNIITKANYDYDLLHNERNQNMLEEKSKLEHETAEFRKNVKAGDYSSCGLVVEVRGNLIQVSTHDGVRWIRLDNLYPSNTQNCMY